ncbi:MULTISPECIES: LysM peptidoglycan-binding domain-containing protein [unclassified Butyrivibrio]|uniref:LysM peptidoglycan-binding domain-containing protein n=1 Tax=unclassified Butyrivibrio TaxID=2639466 RepID=UPI0004259791|nr:MULTISPECIES: LysM peptidoglycan-binding domain-containing protein [unclassified Butyrivibrio]SEK34199.1 LysM domain-containing protein [Butyrivibrio sp. ob235]
MREVVVGGKTYSYSENCEKSFVRSMNNKKRREIQLRRRVVTFCVSVSVIIFLALILSFSFKSDASSSDDHQQYRYYSSVSIASGDSVYSIAEKYMDDLHYRDINELAHDIASINRISTNTDLVAGSKIFVPYYDDFIK